MIATATPRLVQSQAALCASPQAELRHLLAEESESTVVIRGRVSSFYQKQLAQETVKTACSLRVVNLVEVND